MREGKGESLLSFPNNFCVVDIETTGLDYSCDIIEVSAIRVVNGVISETFSELIKPDDYYFDDAGNIVYIDDFISDLTGITNEMLSKADSISSVLPRLEKFISSDILVGHNIASFDSNFLYDAYSNVLGKTFANDFVDTMRLSRWIVPNLEHHRLVDLAHFFSINTDGMHRGLKDCEITYHCFCGLKKLVVDEYGSTDKFCSYIHKRLSKSNYNVRAKDIEAETTDFDISNPIYGSVCVFTGTLEKMTRKEAMQIVKNLGGENGDSVTKKTNFLILGNNDFCKSIKDGKSSKQKKAEKLKSSGVDIEIISESVFYDMAGVK